ncbi:glycoside hydrolase family 30 protein [Paradesertivirga mongoliensis]|uniref:Glycoside hydrolase family 30 protein n=1 Tax=Paradesertivirga mongoliensis TaxID=2100740 RepID=A0ABW4ZKR6_9SPHI|nr:glycoside hydrolase family 30 protein [Pedobacter mongoliensis]
MSEFKTLFSFLLVAIILQSPLRLIAQEQQEGKYVIRLDKPKQVIWGLGVEVQNDAIGSGNSGLPDKVVAIPHDLIRSERKRFYKDLLKGFRYCRLAMGLYFRGLDTSGRYMEERYPNQLSDLKEMITKSGMEGISMEYWSPAPYWKSTNSYLGGTLKSDKPEFLDAFGDALSADIRYITKSGIKVSMWGLQNEPSIGSVETLTLGTAPQSYSHCYYEPDLYFKTFKAVAPKINQLIPKSLIMVDSWNGNSGDIGKLIQKDTSALKYVGAWVYHRIGSNSDQIRKESPIYTSNTFGRPVYQNEFEYQKPTNDSLCINTAQNIMNWFTFANSPTWFWLHALKPTYNVEASGYCLGFWRPEDDNNYTNHSSIKKRHWDYNPDNFNAIAGFLKYMPWNSQRYEVDEPVIRNDNRIMAFKTPKGKLAFVLTNRSQTPFSFDVSTGLNKKFKGVRYSPAVRNEPIGMKKGKDITTTLQPLSIEFWVEQ